MRPGNRQHKGEKTNMISQKESKIIPLYDEEFSNITTGLIKGAQKKIYITTYKLEPKKGARAVRINALIKELFNAHIRGVQIYMLLNFYENHKATSNINWYAARLFQRNGIIVKYQNSGRTLHQKLILIDNTYIVAGSHNLSVQSLAENIELSFLIQDDTIYQENETKFLKLWESAKDFPWCK